MKHEILIKHLRREGTIMSVQHALSVAHLSIVGEPGCAIGIQRAKRQEGRLSTLNTQSWWHAYHSM